MNNPITDFQVGQSRHREMEAEVNHRWGQGSNNEALAKQGLMIVAALLGIVATVIVFIF